MQHVQRLYSVRVLQVTQVCKHFMAASQLEQGGCSHVKAETSTERSCGPVVGGHDKS